MPTLRVSFLPEASRATVSVPSLHDDRFLPLDTDEDGVAAFAVRQALLSARSVDDLWERWGTRQLYVVAGERVSLTAEVLAETALGHRPELITPSQGPSHLREAVILTCLRLRRGDVLLVVHDDLEVVPAWIEQGARWRHRFALLQGKA